MILTILTKGYHHHHHLRPFISNVTLFMLRLRSPKIHDDEKPENCVFGQREKKITQLIVLLVAAFVDQQHKLIFLAQAAA